MVNMNLVMSSSHRSSSTPSSSSAASQSSFSDLLHSSTEELEQYTNFLSLMPMRKDTKVQEYVPSEFQELTREEREDWLELQCVLFEEETRSSLDTNNENDNFIDDFGRYLKKVTRRWASWNHRSFGSISSIDQVKELVDWEEQTQQKFPTTSQQQQSITTNSTSDTSSNENNPLKRFTQYCERSKNLLHIFRIDIYRPLCDYFKDVEDEVPKSVERIVQKWEALLHFSPLNEKLFNTSRDKLVNTSLRVSRSTDAHLVERLVPDLHQKKLEVLRLANKWCLISKAKVNQRRGTYTLSPKSLVDREGKQTVEIGNQEFVNVTQRETMPRKRIVAVSQELVNQDYEHIQDELYKSRTRYDETSQELRAAQEKCKYYEDEMTFCRTECANLRDQLQHTAELRKAIEMKVNDSYSSNGTGFIEENNNDRTTSQSVVYDTALWEKELERIKNKYSRQKIKFMNARKQIEALNKQLEISQTRCTQLHSKFESDVYSCRALEKQLETARKNIQTQGTMVDALQHQCYTLKQELDSSNVKKGELYTQLNNTLQHCKNVEHDLKLTRLKFKELTDENGRRQSREEELERENVQLRKLIEQNGLRRRSAEAMNTVEYNALRRRSMETFHSEQNLLRRRSAENYSLPPNDKQWKHQVPSLQSSTIKELNRPKSPANKPKDCMFPDINAARSF
uniref:PUMA/OVT1 coiled-coil region domain-containing protein n=2 Tax=Clytia hemisphaerica TaxID=252671 RepID=A0A7M5X8J1_9CNID